MRTPSRLLAAVALMAVLVAACGDDDSTAASDSSTTTTAAAETTSTTEAATASQLQVTLTADGIELSQDSIPGGVVEISVDNQTGANTDANFTQVDGADHTDSFIDAFAPVLDGGPLPDWVLKERGCADRRRQRGDLDVDRHARTG